MDLTREHMMFAVERIMIAMKLVKCGSWDDERLEEGLRTFLSKLEFGDLNILEFIEELFQIINVLLEETPSKLIYNVN